MTSWKSFNLTTSGLSLIHDIFCVTDLRGERITGPSGLSFDVLRFCSNYSQGNPLMYKDFKKWMDLNGEGVQV